MGYEASGAYKAPANDPETHTNNPSLRDKVTKFKGKRKDKLVNFMVYIHSSGGKDVVIPPESMVQVELRVDALVGAPKRALYHFTPSEEAAEWVKMPEGLGTLSRAGIFEVPAFNPHKMSVTLYRNRPIGTITFAHAITTESEAIRRLTVAYDLLIRQVADLEEGNHTGKEPIATLALSKPEPSNNPNQCHDMSSEERRARLSPQIIMGAKVTPAEAQSFIQFCCEHDQIFAVTPDEFGKCTIMEASLDTGEAESFQTHSIRYSWDKQKLIDVELRQMKKLGIIRDSTSEYCSPLVAVAKKDGGIRIVTDFRKLNSQIKTPAYPLPRQDDLLERVGECKPKYFSKIDMKMAFFQMCIREEDKPKTAFKSHNALYEYERLPMGTCASAQLFQALMNRVLNGMDSDRIFNYMDDVLIVSTTFEEHLDLLRDVFHRFNKAGLMLRPEKCQFLMEQVQYLGHILSARGLETDPGKTSAMDEFPRPNTTKKVKRFLGMSSYYRRFIKDFSKVAYPLNQLMKKDALFEWTAECEKAFQALKYALVTSPVLHHADFSKPFFVETDGSGTGIGAVLEQKDNNNMFYPLAYASRGLNVHEANYVIAEIEALAVVFGLRKFQHWIDGHDTTVITDCSALKFLTNSVKPATGRLHRWALEVSDAQVKIAHRPGRHHDVPDSLSRIHDEPDPKLPDLFEEGEYGVHKTSIIFDQLDQDDYNLLIRDLQKQDPELMDIIRSLEATDDPRVDSIYPKQGYSLKHSLLYKEVSGSNRLVIPAMERRELIRNYHHGRLGGHFGIEKVYRSLAQHFWWPRMDRSVHNYVKSCEVCAQRRGQGIRCKPPLKPIPWPSRPMEMCGMDITQIGKQKLLVMIDYLSRFTWVFPMPNEKAETVAATIKEHLFPYFGWPERILSDRGTNFLSKVFQDFLQIYGISHTKTTAGHPQTDGLTEKQNSVIQGAISKVHEIYGGSWEDYLSDAITAYNTQVHSVTQKTPYELMFLREPKKLGTSIMNMRPSKYLTSIDHWSDRSKHQTAAIWKEAQRLSTAEGLKNKAYYDQKRDPKVKIRVGDRCWLYSERLITGTDWKLCLPYTGPYLVQNIYENNTVDILEMDNDEAQPIMVNIGRLGKCNDSISELPDRLRDPLSIHSLVEGGTVSTQIVLTQPSLRLHYTITIPSRRGATLPRDTVRYLDQPSQALTVSCLRIQREGIRRVHHTQPTATQNAPQGSFLPYRLPDRQRALLLQVHHSSSQADALCETSPQKATRLFKNCSTTDNQQTGYNVRKGAYGTMSYNNSYQGGYPPPTIPTINLANSQNNASAQYPPDPQGQNPLQVSIGGASNYSQNYPSHPSYTGQSQFGQSIGTGGANPFAHLPTYQRQPYQGQLTQQMPPFPGQQNSGNWSNQTALYHQPQGGQPSAPEYYNQPMMGQSPSYQPPFQSTSGNQNPYAGQPPINFSQSLANPSRSFNIEAPVFTPQNQWGLNSGVTRSTTPAEAPDNEATRIELLEREVGLLRKKNLLLQNQPTPTDGPTQVIPSQTGTPNSGTADSTGSFQHARGSTFGAIYHTRRWANATTG